MGTLLGPRKGQNQCTQEEKTKCPTECRQFRQRSHEKKRVRIHHHWHRLFLSFATGVRVRPYKQMAIYCAGCLWWYQTFAGIKHRATQLNSKPFECCWLFFFWLAATIGTFSVRLSSGTMRQCPITTTHGTNYNDKCYLVFQRWYSTFQFCCCLLPSFNQNHTQNVMQMKYVLCLSFKVRSIFRLQINETKNPTLVYNSNNKNRTNALQFGLLMRIVYVWCQIVPERPTRR